MNKIILGITLLFFSCGKVQEQKYFERDINYYILLHKENIDISLSEELSPDIQVNDFINFCIIDAYVVSGLDSKFRHGNFGGLHGCYNGFNVDENEQIKFYYNFLVSTKKLNKVRTPLDLIQLSFYPKTYPDLNLSVEKGNFTQVADFNGNCVIEKNDVKVHVEKILKNNLHLLRIYKKYQQ